MHGVINLDKPKGITSQDAVTKVKRCLKVKKAGHAGTLDPMATGVLLVCVGEATKVARFLADMDKEYAATLKLGERTDTLDAEGTVIERADSVNVSLGDITRVLEGFKGEIRQIPPMYSALKRSGTPLYELARKGIEVERQERAVHIYEIEIVGFDGLFLTIRVKCSKGTYIRTLADDIGRALGPGAHLSALRRTKIGKFRAEESINIENLTDESLIPIDNTLSHLKELTTSPEEYKFLSKGTSVSITAGKFPESEYIRLYDPHGKLFAIGFVSLSPTPRLNIERILNL